MRRTRHFLAAILMCLAPAALADTAIDENPQVAVAQRGAVIVRVPFDKLGHPVLQKAQLRVLEGQAAEQRVTDHQSAEAAWKEAKTPAYLQVAGLASADATIDQPPPDGFYTWRPGFAPGYVNSRVGWHYGAPGFYFGWSGPGSAFSFGYGPGYTYTPAPGWGYAGGYSGWYGAPLGPTYSYPYPGWYRPGYGYYYYPRAGGVHYRR